MSLLVCALSNTAQAFKKKKEEPVGMQKYGSSGHKQFFFFKEEKKNRMSTERFFSVFVYILFLLLNIFSFPFKIFCLIFPFFPLK